MTADFSEPVPASLKAELSVFAITFPLLLQRLKTTASILIKVLALANLVWNFWRNRK